MNRWTVVLAAAVLLVAVGCSASGNPVAPGGGDHYSTYHVEIPADKVSGAGWTEEFWVIAEYEGFDYTNDLGVPNLAGTDHLAAFFRYDLYVHGEPYNTPPVVDSGVDGDDTPHVLMIETYTVTAHDDDGDPLTYFWTVTDNSTGTPVSGYDGVPGDDGGFQPAVHQLDLSILEGFHVRFRHQAHRMPRGREAGIIAACPRSANPFGDSRGPIGRGARAICSSGLTSFLSPTSSCWKA